MNKKEVNKKGQTNKKRRNYGADNKKKKQYFKDNKQRDSRDARNNKKTEGKQIEELKFIKYQKNDIVVENNTLVGVYEKSRNFGFVIPDDKKLIKTDVFVSKNKVLNAKDGQKVVVKITKMPANGKKAEGEIVEVLGNQDMAGIDMMSLIREYDLPYEFPKEVENEAKKYGTTIEGKLNKNREDFRNEEIFTIDGEDAKDLDDAVSVRKTKKGTYILSVHIADVSQYVREDSFLDKEAILRGTSVYMLDRVIPMLPKELSNGICSLNANVDRFALSAIMEIDKNGIVLSTDVKKTIIKVTKRMSYKEVQIILDNYDEKLSNIEDENVKQIVRENKEYKKHFKLMEELALILKQRRKKAGSLSLDLPETKVILDENGMAIDIIQYPLYFSNQIVEHFMLTANEAIAEMFVKLEIPFMYRVHENPDIEKVNELNKYLFNFNLKVEVKDDEVEPIAIEEVLNKIKGMPEERTISTLVLRTLKVARYESENIGHFGIASKYYCHFTSPIRRYPDLFIHRIISKYLAGGKSLIEKESEKLIKMSEKYAKSSSDREKIAQKVERDSVDIKQAEFMEDKIGQEFDAVVSSITSFGMFVELENTVEGLVRFDCLGNEYFNYDEDNKTLLGEKSKTLFKIGSKVRVKLLRANKQLRQIDFKRID